MYKSQNNNQKVDSFDTNQDLQDIPLKSLNKVKQFFKIKQEQQQLLQQVNYKKSSKSSNNTINNTLTSSKSKSNGSLFEQKQSQSNNLSINYVLNCAIRALQIRKLAIDDIAEIFAIEPQIVEQIDKFRRLKEFQNSQGIINPKFKIRKDKMLGDLQNKIKNSVIREFNENSFSRISLSKRQNIQRKNSISVDNFRTYYNLGHSHNGLNQNTNMNKLSALNYLSQSFQQNEEQNLFEYQKILRRKPPHRLDAKTIAIVDILKKNPNLLQKDIIKLLDEEYEIKGVTQTNICRYIKRIYEMQKHVKVLQQAIQDGFLDLDAKS